MKYTKHALQRMTERNLTKPMVLGVMLNTYPIEQVDGTKRYSLNGINVVVIEGLDGEERILTAYENRIRSRKRRRKVA